MPEYSASNETLYRQSIFSIPKMACPSEKNLIRMALGNAPEVRSLSFDLAQRQLKAVHHGEPDTVLHRLQPLKL
jgi:hypothetical protein